MRMLALGAIAMLLSAVALQATAEARARVFRSSQPSMSRSHSQKYQPRSRAGAYANPSFLQGSHKALGNY